MKKLQDKNTHLTMKTGGYADGECLDNVFYFRNAGTQILSHSMKKLPDESTNSTMKTGGYDDGNCLKNGLWISQESRRRYIT